jgi:hypothetical protein
MAKRKRIQQRYEIDMSMQAWDLAKAGSALTIKVHGREGLLGTIEIGQGSFRWKTARSHSFKRIRWRRLAQELDEISA